MKKRFLFLLAAVWLFCLAGCAEEVTGVKLPFEPGDVQYMTISYQEAELPMPMVDAVYSPDQIEEYYKFFQTVPLQKRRTKVSDNASCTYFCFVLRDGSSYNLTYIANGVKNGILKSDGYAYFTSADVNGFWRNISGHSVVVR